MLRDQQFAYPFEIRRFSSCVVEIALSLLNLSTPASTYPHKLRRKERPVKVTLSPLMTFFIPAKTWPKTYKEGAIEVIPTAGPSLSLRPTSCL